MNDKYYIITTNDSGDIRISETTQKSILEMLKDEELDEDDFIEKLDGTEDLMYWGGKCIIFKGKIVTPTPKTTVSEFEIE